MSTEKKQLGDAVRINRGELKDKIGVLEAKEQRSWVVRLENGEAVSVPFPFVEKIETTAEAILQETEQTEVESPAATESVETAQPEAEHPTAEAEPPATAAAEPVEPAQTEAEQTEVAPSTAELESAAPQTASIMSLTVKQLQEKAKEAGIGIARTKSDFLRIIGKMHPEEDLTTLKGPALFDRVTELHISRLRSKEDLQNLLSVR